MACTACTPPDPSSYSNPYRPCLSTPSQCCEQTDATCIIYTGPALTCLSLPSGSNLQEFIQAADEVICQSGFVWGDYDTHCIKNPDDSDVSSMQEFVEDVTSFICDFKEEYDTFVETTYVEDLETIQDQVDAIKVPGLTSCGGLGITNTDTYLQVLGKYNTKICDILSAINTSTANWGSACIVTSPAPTTIIGAINALLTMICTVRSSIPASVTLPTFNNVGSCLPSPTTTDTLVATINKIKTVLCALPDFDADLIDVGCSAPITDLQDAIQGLYAETSGLLLNTVRSVDTAIFALEDEDPEEPCTGKKLTLAAGASFTDKFVAVNVSDTSPGYLFDKLAAGTGVTLDTSTNAGKVTITAPGVDTKVKADAADTSADYLINKIDGKTDTSGAIVLTESYNATTDKVDITPSINYSILAAEILDQISGSEELTEQFCLLACACACTTQDVRRVRGIISNLIPDEGEAQAIKVNVTFGQNASTATWFSGSGVVSGGVINTGYYTATSIAIPLTGFIEIQNTDIIDILYHIYVEDADGDPVPSSTDISGTIADGATFTFNPLVYGDTTDYTLMIDLTPSP